MITREFNLYLHAGHSIPLVINVNQYDHGEQWLFSLFNSDGTQYTPSSGAIVGIKSDNLGIINSGTVDSQGRVVINETQQMTASVGKAVFELVIDDGTHGTANFVVLVEEKPGNNADLSETDISMIEQAIEAASSIKPYGSPLVASTVAGMTDHEKVYVYVGSETGYTSGNWYYWDGTAWTSGGVYNSVAVQTDTTLTLSGVAADAKKTGDEISDLKSQIATGGLKDSVKNALLQIARKVAYIDDGGQDYYDALYSAFYNAEVLSISAVFDTGGVEIFDTATLDDLKQYLTVTANYDNGTSGTVTGYTLSGLMTSGIQEITVSYGGKSATFNATIYHNYAHALTSWIKSASGTFVGDSIQLKGTQTNANSWKIWCAEKQTPWGDVKGKTFKARLTLRSPDWVGEMSTASPVNVVAYDVAVYSSTSTSSLADRVVNFNETRIIPTDSEVVYETEPFVATTENTSVTDSYRFGIYLYNASANTLILTKAELIEVFEDSEA